MKPTPTPAPTHLFVRLHPTQGEDVVCIVECQRPEDVPLVSSSVGHKIPQLNGTVAVVSPEPFQESLPHHIGEFGSTEWMALVA